MSEEKKETIENKHSVIAGVSLRGWITLLLILNLCLLTWTSPVVYMEIFKLSVATVIGFYFGQAKQEAKP